MTTLGSHVSARLRTVPGLPPAEQKAIASAVRASGGSSIAQLRAQPGGKQIVAASADALSSSARTVALTAAGFVLCGLFVTAGLPNPRGGADPAPPVEKGSSARGRR